MTDEERIELRLECLRIAIEFGTQRDIMNPSHMAQMYYDWVVQGSGESRPDDSRKDGGLTPAKKARSVRKGSTPQIAKM
jgi:hypothetical protein|tara:strand:+ start:1526 stop:1762 length:237 start_codon:yes stop_codon:yes gene_type:complete